MTLTNDRIPWDSLKQNYDKWRAEGRWIRGVFWFGFDVAHSWMMGTENMLVAMIVEPKFVQDIFETYLSHTRAVKWAHDHGAYAQLHSCGDVMTLLSDIVATGVDALNPLEVKAGMDVFDIKKRYGDRLTLRGGFIFSSDHSIPTPCR